MIYFLRPTDGGPIKIGFTDNLDARHKKLEAYYGQPLALLATMDGGRNEERAIHKRFDHLRFGRTEQFRPAADLMAFIGRPLLVDANPDAVEAIPALFTLVGLQRSPEWREWLIEYATFKRMSMSDLIDEAVMKLARSEDYPKMPPKR